MNYYEELGIRPDAGEEEIRKAHRRLVKIMHPDQHRDQGLKQLAETQMRRLNSLVATLLDPEERFEYDEQLRAELLQRSTPQQPAWRSLPWWIFSTAGAIVLTVGAVWFWADRSGNAFATHTPVIVENPSLESTEPGKLESDFTAVPRPKIDDPTQYSQALSAGQSDPSNTTVARVTTPGKPKSAPPRPTAAKSSTSKTAAPPTAAHSRVVRKPVDAAKPARTDSSSDAERAKQLLTLRTAEDSKKVADVPLVAKLDMPKHPWDRKLQAPGASDMDSIGGGGDVHLPLPNAPDFTRKSSGARRDPLEGEWVYAPTEPEKRKSGFYPPEFIRLKLRKQPDGMHGEYKARYNIADSRPVSPEVSFELKSVDKASRKFVWTAGDGRHGTFEIRELESDTMRLEWRTTGGRSGPALNSGMATLVRKN